MADYTSSTSGNWDADATWGGGGHPTSAGDTATISSGHTVTYNVNSTTVWGNITVNGLLTFATGATTKLMIGQNTIAIANGGELRIGASGAVIGASYTATVDIASTSDSDRITIAEGGKLTIYGDPAYYGSDDDTTLASNWTTGQTFTVTGDFTTKWVANQMLTVHKGTTYSNYSSDITLVTIASVAANGANTDVTINEAKPDGTFYSGGQVLNVSRNVILQKNGAITAIGQTNSNRPRIADSNTVAGNVNLSNARFVGFYRVLSGGVGSVVSKCVMCNGESATYSGTSHTISGNVYSNTNGIFTGMSHTISGNIYSNSNGINAGTSHTISGNVYSNSNGIYYGMSHTISGNVYSNTNGIFTGMSHTISGNIYSNTNGIRGSTAILLSSSKLGFDSGGSTAENTNDIVLINMHPTKVISFGAKLPSSPAITRNAVGYEVDGGLLSEDHGQTIGASYAYRTFGDVIKNTSTVRSGGATSSMEVVPYSACTTVNYLPIFEWCELDVAASEQTRGVYVRGSNSPPDTNWSTFPTNSELWFEAEYFSAGSGTAKTIIKSTEVISDNTTWTKLDVTFTPSQAGQVRYRMYLGKYASGCKIYVDNQLQTS